MKRLIFFILSIIFFQNINAQELMTIREVFNFEIGDKFQFRTSGETLSGNYIPPNADRITISDKFYSNNQDTLFYVNCHDSYTSEVSWEGGPHLVYSFWTKTDTVFYVNIDSSIIYYDPGFGFNQYSYQSVKLCDSLINGCSYYLGPGFENDKYIDEYGRGLGHTYWKDSIAQYPSPWHITELFYYKKGILSCGTPDLTTVGIDKPISEDTNYFIYPNPVETTFNLQNKSHKGNFQCRLYNPLGQIIMNMELSGETNKINVSHIKRGIYYLELKMGNEISTFRLIKE